MNPGDLVQIRGTTAPMYADSDWVRGKGGHSYHIGYARDGSTGIFMGSDDLGAGGKHSVMIFHLILTPQFGPVWIRGIWVHEVAA